MVTRPDVRLVPVEEVSRDLLPAALRSAPTVQTAWREMFRPRRVEVLERIHTRWVEGPGLMVLADLAVTLRSVNAPEDLERTR